MGGTSPGKNCLEVLLGAPGKRGPLTPTHSRSRGLLAGVHRHHPAGRGRAGSPPRGFLTQDLAPDARGRLEEGPALEGKKEAEASWAWGGALRAARLEPPASSGNSS